MSAVCQGRHLIGAAIGTPRRSGLRVDHTRYDALKRATEIHRWSSGVDQADQLVKMYYDSNPFDGAFGTNVSGRLAATEFWTRRKRSTWVGYDANAMVNFKEMYAYSPAGLMIGKRLRAAAGASTNDLDASYTFDNEGRMISQKYPTASAAGETFAYGFDAMGRPNTMTSNGGGATSWITGVTYNHLGLPTAITATNPAVAGETREYNELGQLKKIVSGAYDFRYNFSTTNNDGRITSQESRQGGVLQETVGYNYDALNRLTSASGAGWSAAYGYDGFTNLLDITPTGAGPSQMHVTVNPATNRLNGWTHDANGNVVAKPGTLVGFTADYYVENQLREATGPAGLQEYYGYGADSRRVYQSQLDNPATGSTFEYVTFWSAGKRVGRYKLLWSGSTFAFEFSAASTNVYFGGKPLRLGAETNVVTDRLGSVRRTVKDYFPYGQENPSTTTGEKEKYATYLHDGRTDLSYADQRYYATGAGRFMTADPAGSGLNWYSYVGGDPVNASDPSGLRMEWLLGGNALCAYAVDGALIGCRGADTGLHQVAGAVENALFAGHLAVEILILNQTVDNRIGGADSDPTTPTADDLHAAHSCIDIFGTDSSPSAILDGMLSHPGQGILYSINFGSIKLGDLVPEAAVRPTPVELLGTVAMTAPITLNTYPTAGFSTGFLDYYFLADLSPLRDRQWLISPMYGALTFIHELGHVYEVAKLGGQKVFNGPGLPNDNPVSGSVNSSDNSATVFNHCISHTLKYYATRVQ